GGAGGHPKGAVYVQRPGRTPVVLEDRPAVVGIGRGEERLPGGGEQVGGTGGRLPGQPVPAAVAQPPPTAHQRPVVRVGNGVVLVPEQADRGPDRRHGPVRQPDGEPLAVGQGAYLRGGPRLHVAAPGGRTRFARHQPEVAVVAAGHRAHGDEAAVVADVQGGNALRGGHGALVPRCGYAAPLPGGSDRDRWRRVPP